MPIAIPSPTFALCIATKNRQADLMHTLCQSAELLAHPALRCVVFDDGSSDHTSSMVRTQFPKVELWRNETSKGYLYCRNKMLNEINATYLISLDDDAHFLSSAVLQTIQQYFETQPCAGVLAFRIFWSTDLPITTETSTEPLLVKSYVGCGHVWRKTVWDAIPDYPEWYAFYGEENWAALQVYQQHFSVHYVPQILVHHRVNLQQRAKLKAGFYYRYRCSLRADWFTFLLLYPLRDAMKYWMYSWIKQLQKMIRTRQFKLAGPFFFATVDLLFRIPKLVHQRKPLSATQFKAYDQLNEAIIYWNPEK